MKIVVVFLFSLIFTQINAQVWVDQGAVWHYNFSAIATGGYEKLEYTEDTIVDGIVCQKIMYTKSNFGTNQNGDIIAFGVDNGLKGITYVNGDTVFYRRNNHFFVLYNFCAQIGDSWIIDTLANSSDPYCGDTSRVEVVDVGTININGSDYRFIEIASTDDSPFQLSGKFVERFGPYETAYTAHSLFPELHICDPAPIVDYVIYDFKCFQDNSFNLYIPTGGSCEYKVGLEEVQLTDKSLGFYPNPVLNTLHVTISGEKELNQIKIMNVMGEVIRFDSFTSNSFNLDVSILESGIYFLEINDSQSQKFIKL